MQNKKENSVTANIHGFQAPSGTKLIKKDRDLESFEELVTFCELNDKDLSEVVKKRGDSWVVFDDKTKTQKGVFKDRKAAWARQKQLRQQTKDNRKNKSKANKSQKAHTAPKPQMAPKPQLAPKAKKEHLLRMFKENITKIIKEGSALSYVFEQSPLPNDSDLWDLFLEKVSKQTLLSDPKFRSILENMAKSEVKLLGNAVLEIKKVLESTGNFEVEQKKPDQDESGVLFLPFEVKLLQNNKKLIFAVLAKNGKPLIQFPEQTKSELNALSNDESKLLRAELLHVQETSLDNMQELYDSTVKRDEYLRKTQETLDKTLKTLDPLKIVLMRFLLRTRYASIK